MKKVIVTRTNGATYSAEMEDPTPWISECIENNSWGLPERDVFGEDGLPTGEKLPAEYTIEIQDVTFEKNLETCISNRLAEYPTPQEFMNQFFDSGEQGLADLQALRLQVKAKYPKPQP